MDKINTVACCVQGGGFGQTDHLSHVSPDFATQLLEGDYDVRTVQELLRHADVKMTMIDTHVLNRGGRGVPRSLDGM